MAMRAPSIGVDPRFESGLALIRLPRYGCTIGGGMAVTVLIVDDHAGFRARARKLLEAGGFAVLEAEDGNSALGCAASFAPELVLLDVQLPGLDGFDVAGRLAADGDGPVVVLTSTRDAADYGDRVASAPVAGFVPKDELSADALRSFLRRHR